VVRAICLILAIPLSLMNLFGDVSQPTRVYNLKQLGHKGLDNALRARFFCYHFQITGGPSITGTDRVNKREAKVIRKATDATELGTPFSAANQVR
jgi:hypothetical protein